MQFDNYFDLLKKYNQEHILEHWNELNDHEKKALMTQIDIIDLPLIAKLSLLALEEKVKKTKIKLEPAESISLSERNETDPQMIKKGEELLRSGRVGAFLVAGGQGSRLGFDGPKGIYPITPIKKKSLFQLHAEKILAMSRHYTTKIPWYIMTSQSNHEQTVNFFKKNNYFGLDKETVIFFSQEMLPAIDKNGKLIMIDKGEIFMSPNGHGGSLKALWDSGAYEDLVKRKIKYLFYFQVDNVLVNICDPAFLGYHHSYNAEMSSKVLRKAFPEEKIGVICKIDGKTGVIEYSDLGNEDMYAKDLNGDLKYWAGSIAIHIINTEFIEKENNLGFQLPYHIAEKSIPYIGKNNKKIITNEKNGYKFETFVFDALAHCDKTITIEVKREEEFSAVKNKEGVDSKNSALKDMSNQYLRWLKNAGVNIPEMGEDEDLQVEISPLFAFSEQKLQEKKSELPEFSKKLYLG